MSTLSDNVALAFSIANGNAELLEELRNIRAWLNYWKDRTISQQSKDERGHVANSWAACPIPDWDVKQKLESLDALIERAERRAEGSAKK